jgi:murein DD-endopeptidase MepM/ murein hydrolase activator NlpD
VIRLVLTLAVLVAATGVVRPSEAAQSCAAASTRAYVYQQAPRHQPRRLRALENAALACASGTQTISFWPQGGLLDHDLYLANTVDLDAGAGIRDPWCGTRTYDTHTGEDVVIRGFREQAIGVPVFAAVDGRVTQVQEGQKDTNFGTQTLPWDNHVEIDSGHDQFEIYGHFRRGSVRVKVGDWVVAGEQIGLTGSSGNSSWPHLHLTMIVGSQPVDLWSGPCNARSVWAGQPTLRTDPWARDFELTAAPFDDRSALPWDEGPHSSSFPLGTHDLWFRSLLYNSESVRTQTVQIVRPDGSVALSETGAPTWTAFRQAVASWHERPALDVAGTWRIQVSLDGNRLLDQPFEVGAPPANRAPAAVSATLSRTGDGVWLCQVGTSLLNADPDGDVVSYRYRWRSGGKVIRAVRTAGLQDALPRTTAGKVSCSVTPTDGRLNGPTVTA